MWCWWVSNVLLFIEAKTWYLKWHQRLVFTLIFNVILKNCPLIVWSYSSLPIRHWCVFFLSSFFSFFGTCSTSNVSPLMDFSLFLFHLPFSFLIPLTAHVVTGDQSPSSPASRWPGANYGNRTLGVFLFHCLS